MTPEQREYILSLDQDGTITPDALLEAARPEESPIHGMFTWDDADAGNRYRLSEARAIIRRVRVEVIERSVDIRAIGYIRDPEAEKKTQGYVRAKLLRTRTEAATAALDAEIATVAAYIERARRVAVGLGMSEECEARLLALVTPPAEEAAG